MTIKHSFLPPSGAAAWSQCALWPSMNVKYPEANTTSAEEGTAAHWVMAERLSSRSPLEDSLTPNGMAVTPEMLEGAELVEETVDKLMPSFYAWHIEETLGIPAIHPDCFGTPDIWWSTGDTLHIIDYKFGHSFVDEYWNPQGLLYMTGIIGQLPSIPTEVSFTIVQPRCFYRGDPVRTHTYYINHATTYLSKLREAANRAMIAQPVATTGAHCEHCPGRHACPTLQKAAYDSAETSTDQQPVELTPQAAALELRLLSRALTRLEARVSGLRELTTANIKAGASVPHYSLENGRSSRKWTITPEEVIKLGKKKKVKLDVPKVLTPTQAFKLLSLDESHYSKYSEIIPGGLKLVESNNADATRVFKKET